MGINNGERGFTAVKTALKIGLPALGLVAVTWGAGKWAESFTQQNPVIDPKATTVEELSPEMKATRLRFESECVLPSLGLGSHFKVTTLSDEPLSINGASWFRIDDLLTKEQPIDFESVYVSGGHTLGPGMIIEAHTVDPFTFPGEEYRSRGVYRVSVFDNPPGVTKIDSNNGSILKAQGLLELGTCP